MPTPCIVEEIDTLAITSGCRPTSPALGARPRSTRAVVPAPPGVTMAQFNRGSMATLGLAPVPKGVTPLVIVVTGQGGAPQGGVRLVFAFARSRIVPTFVD